MSIFASSIGKLVDDVAKIGMYGKFSNLTYHFNKHKLDFGVQTIEEYYNLAKNFLTGNKGVNTLEKVRENGDIVRYDTVTEYFGVISKEKVIRTFYKPNSQIHGYSTNLDYFNAQ